MEYCQEQLQWKHQTTDLCCGKIGEGGEIISKKIRIIMIQMTMKMAMTWGMKMEIMNKIKIIINE